MSKKSWPIRTGLFRSTCHSDTETQRSPSPIVEMPLSPQPSESSRSRRMSSPPLKIITNMNANRRAGSQGPFSPSSQGPFSPSSQAPFSPLSQAPFSPASQGPFSPASQRGFSPSSQRPFSPTINKAVREIPIEVQQEVCCNSNVCVGIYIYIIYIIRLFRLFSQIPNSTLTLPDDLNVECFCFMSHKLRCYDMNGVLLFL